MPTLLVTKKMSPELAARVQASVSGKRALPGARVAPRTRSLLRIVLFMTIVASSTWLALSWQRFKRDTESQRGALLGQVRDATADVDARELRMHTALHPWLLRLSGTYPEDLIAEEMRVPGAFEATLERPTVYMRGLLANFEAMSTVEESAENSFIDAFVLCLNHPPKERKEKPLRANARAALFADSEGMKRTAHVVRLHDAFFGLPFLEPAWEQRVVEATSQEEIAKLKKRFDRAPLAATKRALRAKLLLVVMDEPGDKTAPAELDGERAHAVRVGLVDLTTQKLLLRLRRQVDPSWISAAGRAEFAGGIDSCALAMDVHAAVAKKPDADPN
jgi:hypothetical protein